MTGWHATYRIINPAIPKGERGHCSWRELPVAYWSDGYGWVSAADYQTRPEHLVRADEVRFLNWEFQGYHPSRKVVAALPATGWSARYSNEWEDPDNHGTADSPLVAWIAYDDGEVRPIDMGTDGWGHNPCDLGNFVCLVPPGGEVPDEA